MVASALIGEAREIRLGRAMIRYREVGTARRSSSSAAYWRTARSGERSSRGSPRIFVASFRTCRSEGTWEFETDCHKSGGTV